MIYLRFKAVFFISAAKVSEPRIIWQFNGEFLPPGLCHLATGNRKPATFYRFFVLFVL
jgi:hypothetical protein